MVIVSGKILINMAVKMTAISREGGMKFVFGEAQSSVLSKPRSMFGTM